MANSGIPEEFLRDPKFVTCFRATLETEIQNIKVKIQGIGEEIEVAKRTVENKHNERKKLKELTQLQKDKKILLEPTLKRLAATYDEQQLEQKRKAAGLNSKLQRTQEEQKTLQEILDKYKKAWSGYKAEYEKLPLAVERREARNRLGKAKVENKVLEFKRNRLLKMLKQREEIDNARFIVMIVKLTKSVKERWDQQEYLVNLKQQIKDSDIQYEELCEKYTVLEKKAEEEAKAKELARQQMPAPRIDRSLLRSFYASTLGQSKQAPKLTREPSIDSDLISVNSILIQELCNEDNFILKKNRHHKDKEDIQSIGDMSCCAISQEIQIEPREKVQQFKQLEQIDEAGESQYEENNDDNLESLETVCRQLSIEDGSVCYGHDDDQSQEGPAGTTMIVEATIEHQESYRLSHQNSSKLGKKSSSFGNLGEPPAKKSKAEVARRHVVSRSKLPIPIEKIQHQASPQASPLIQRQASSQIKNHQASPLIQRQASSQMKNHQPSPIIQRQASSQMKNHQPSPIIQRQASSQYKSHQPSPKIKHQQSPQNKPQQSFSKPMPQIRKVESIIPPIKLQIKPPMAEVPPTPANLYSNRQYAPSCTSSDNMSAICDTDINWHNFSPPNRSISNLSFTSEASAFKSMIKDTAEVTASHQNHPVKSVNQANNNNPNAGFFAFGGFNNPNPNAFF